MRRRVTWMVTAATAFVVLSWFWSQLWSTRITEENAKRIERGMTLEQVEAILGPERDESGADEFEIFLEGILLPPRGNRGGDKQPHRDYRIWFGRRMVICVCTENDRVCSVDWHEAQWSKVSLSDKLKRWVQKQVSKLQ